MKKQQTIGMSRKLFAKHKNPRAIGSNEFDCELAGSTTCIQPKAVLSVVLDFDMHRLDDGKQFLALQF